MTLNPGSLWVSFHSLPSVSLDSQFVSCVSLSQCVHTESFRVPITILACRCLHSMNDHSSCVKFVVSLCFPHLVSLQGQNGLSSDPPLPPFIMNFRVFFDIHFPFCLERQICVGLKQ